jgi:hypothetical protein
VCEVYPRAPFVLRHRPRPSAGSRPERPTPPRVRCRLQLTVSANAYRHPSRSKARPGRGPRRAAPVYGLPMPHQEAASTPHNFFRPFESPSAESPFQLLRLLSIHSRSEVQHRDMRPSPTFPPPSSLLTPTLSSPKPYLSLRFVPSLREAHYPNPTTNTIPPP